MKSIKKQLVPVIIVSVILFSFSSCNTPKKEEAKDQDAFSFAFLTDIHLQPERNAGQGFRQAIDTVNKLDPDFVITGGDQIMDALGQTESRADSLYDMYIELSGLFTMPVYNDHFLRIHHL